MDVFTRAELTQLLSPNHTHCVSLFLPTHRGGAEQDRIRWKNLLRDAEERLVAAGLRPPEAREFLEAARHLTENDQFWGKQSDGLAAFITPKSLRVYRLPLTFAERVVVQDGFHVKPLLPLLAGDGRFYILALSQKKVRLLQGTAHSVHELDLRHVPHGLAEAMRFHDTDEPLLFHTVPSGGNRWAAIFHGHGVGIDDYKDDLLRYFRQVDQGLQEFLRAERAPLVLAAVEYLWPIYRQANHYPHLLLEGVPGNPDELSAAELHTRARAVVGPAFQQAEARAAAVYAELAGTGNTSGDLAEIVRAAHEGRIEILFVARDRERWGSMFGGEVILHEKEQPGDRDLLNQAAIDTLRHGGSVHVVASLPVPGDAAAVFWLPGSRRQK